MAKRKETALEKLTPNASVVTVDGKELRVPADKSENAIMNTVMASQMRALIQEMIKKYKDGDETLTPKELNDLSTAARNTAAFSNEVYATMPELPKPSEAKADEDQPDFSKLAKPIDVKAEEVESNGKASSPDTGTPSSGLREGDTR